MIIKVAVCLKSRENPTLTLCLETRRRNIIQGPGALGAPWVRHGDGHTVCSERWRMSVLVQCVTEVSLVLSKGCNQRLAVPVWIVCSKFSLLLCYLLTCSCPCKALQIGFVAFVILVSSSADLQCFSECRSGPLPSHRLIPGSWIKSVWWPVPSLREGKMWPAWSFV